MRTVPAAGVRAGKRDGDAARVAGRAAQAAARSVRATRRTPCPKCDSPVGRVDDAARSRRGKDARRRRAPHVAHRRGQQRGASRPTRHRRARRSMWLPPTGVQRAVAAVEGRIAQPAVTPAARQFGTVVRHTLQGPAIEVELRVAAGRRARSPSRAACSPPAGATRLPSKSCMGDFVDRPDIDRQRQDVDDAARRHALARPAPAVVDRYAS